MKKKSILNFGMVMLIATFVSLFNISCGNSNNVSNQKDETYTPTESNDSQEVKTPYWLYGTWCIIQGYDENIRVTFRRSSNELTFWMYGIEEQNCKYSITPSGGMLAFRYYGKYLELYLDNENQTLTTSTGVEFQKLQYRNEEQTPDAIRAEEIVNFSGEWDWEEDSDYAVFSLSLKQEGNKISGTHSAVARGGNRIDDGIDNSSIHGIVSNGVAYVKILSSHAFDEEEIDATIKFVNKSNSRIEWSVKKGHNIMHYFPDDAILIHRKTYSNNQNSVSKSNNTYIVRTKTYFHNAPSYETVRKAYLVKGDIINAIEEKNGYIYAIYTNVKGDKTKGWINKNDLN